VRRQYWQNIRNIAWISSVEFSFLPEQFPLKKPPSNQFSQATG
jgi:hypothetical protein